MEPTATHDVVHRIHCMSEWVAVSLFNKHDEEEEVWSSSNHSARRVIQHTGIRSVGALEAKFRFKVIRI